MLSSYIHNDINNHNKNKNNKNVVSAFIVFGFRFCFCLCFCLRFCFCFSKQSGECTIDALGEESPDDTADVVPAAAVTWLVLNRPGCWDVPVPAGDVRHSGVTSIDEPVGVAEAAAAAEGVLNELVHCQPLVPCRVIQHTPPDVVDWKTVVVVVVVTVVVPVCLNVGVHLLPPLLSLRTVAGDCLVDTIDVLAHCVYCLSCRSDTG